MGKPVSIREFARMRGVSHTAVVKAIRAGRIETVEDGKIDPDTAAVQWEENTDPSKQRGRKIRGKQNVATVYAKARAEREKYNARGAQLNYETKAGKLVYADAVKSEAFQAARLTRDSILNIPNKISHELAAETDPAKVHSILNQALVKALDELAAEGVRRAQISEQNQKDGR